MELSAAGLQRAVGFVGLFRGRPFVGALGCKLVHLVYLRNVLRVIALAFRLVVTVCTCTSQLIRPIVRVVSLRRRLRELQEHLFDFLGREALLLGSIGFLICQIDGHDCFEFA